VTRILHNIVLIALLTSPAWAQFDQQRAFQYLEQQVAFGPRNPGSAGHAKCLAFLQKELDKYADQVELQPFAYEDRFRKKVLRLHNIIARYKPQAKERIFLAAHWDTRPTADNDRLTSRNTPIPGANDGASGVAVLLEIARQLKNRPAAIGVDLIFFDGEDYGREGHLDEYFLGSRYFAQNAKDYKPRYGVLLDMVGDANLTLPREPNSVQALPHIVDKVWQLAHSLGYFEFEDRPGYPVSDDHIVLMEHGIPCIDIIDFEYPDEHHRYWHTLQDTPDKCSAYSLKVVGDVMLQLIYGEKP